MAEENTSNAGQIKWFDYRGHSDATFQFYIGARGVGKTYSALDEIYKTGLRERGQRKWLYIRMTEIELKSTCGHGNAFGDYNLENGTDVEMEYSDKMSEIHLYEPYKSKDIEYTDTLIAYAKSLETFSNLRSVSFADIDWIMFDEFIPQISARRKPIYKIAGVVFKSLYETVNRNRELKGRPPVKCYFFGNANSVDSDILREYDLLTPMSNMLKKGIKKYTNREQSTYLELCEVPSVSNAKRNTALYKAGYKNKEFYRMGLDNAFPMQEFEGIEKKPINEYYPIIQYGEYSIWKHKSADLWYIRRSDSTAKTRYPESDEQLFFRNHYVEYVCRALEHKINYDCVETKVTIDNILGKTLQKSRK